MRFRLVQWFVLTLLVALGLAPVTSASSAVDTGSITGTVTDWSGAPVPELEVIATDADAETLVFETTTDSTGTYVFDDLPVGDYIVRFAGYEGGLQGEFYPDAPTASRATPVAVASGVPTTGIDAVLTVPSRLYGTVTDRDTGEGVAFARVLLFELQGDHWQPTQLDTYTDAQGDYELTGAWGAYRILVMDGEARTHYNTFYPGALDATEATTLEIPQGGEKRVDVQMLGQAQIEGTASAAGESVAGVAVYVEHWDGTRWAYWTYRELTSDGTYTVTVATPGRYRVRFTDPQQRFPDQWWDGQAAADSATPILMDVGGVDVTGVDAELVPLPPLDNVSAPRITGTPEVGQTLAAQAGTWSPEPSLITYLWLSDGEPVLGATSPSYSVSGDDVGTRLSVRVTTQAPGHRNTAVTTEQTAEIPPLTPTPTPTPSPTPVPTPSPTPTTSPTSSTTTPAPTAPEPSLATTTSPPMAEAPDPLKVETRPRVRGTARVGRTLRVTTGSWNTDDDIRFTYQWLADNRRIRKATRARLELVPRLAGKRIAVRVTAYVDSATPVVVRTRLTVRVAD